MTRANPHFILILPLQVQVHPVPTCIFGDYLTFRMSLSFPIFGVVVMNGSGFRSLDHV